MDRKSLYRRLLMSALLIGGMYAIGSLLLGATPLGVVLGTTCVAGLAAVMAFRQQVGQPLLPTIGLVVFGLAGVALNTRALLVGHWPVGNEWIAMLFAWAFPTAILLMAYRQWRATNR